MKLNNRANFYKSLYYQYQFVNLRRNKSHIILNVKILIYKLFYYFYYNYLYIYFHLFKNKFLLNSLLYFQLALHLVSLERSLIDEKLFYYSVHYLIFESAIQMNFYYENNYFKLFQSVLLIYENKLKIHF